MILNMKMLVIKLNNS